MKGPSLAESGADSRVRITDVSGARKLVHRLAALGVVPGAEITVMRPGSPSLISIGGAKIAIGEDAARLIRVEEITR